MYAARLRLISISFSNELNALFTLRPKGAESWAFKWNVIARTWQLPVVVAFECYWHLVH